MMWRQQWRLPPFCGAALRSPQPPHPAPGAVPPAPGFRHALRASPPRHSGRAASPSLRAGGQGPTRGAQGRLETRKGLSGRGKAEEGKGQKGKGEETTPSGPSWGRTWS